MKNVHLYIIVAISGASVLAIEILGTRLLGPFYGVSLFLWSSLITVTLAALSFGYFLGGRLADVRPHMSHLCAIMAGAGLWVILIPMLRHPLLFIMQSLGLRLAVLLAAFILFFPPLTLLGMVSPYALKLRTKSLNEVGRSAGDLYALSTMASVFAALLTGFFLIPRVGVSRLTIIIGCILIATAAIVYGRHRRSGAMIIGSILLMIILIAGFHRVPFDRPQPESGLLSVEQSPYGEIRVIDRDGLRYLLIDGGIHSVVDTNVWESPLRHIIALELNKYFFTGAGRMLLIGLGAGSVAKNYALDGWKVDAVEIDPVVIEMAVKFFQLTPDDCELHLMDGRQFLLTHPAAYDLIIMDAFGSSSIPFHLTTRESFALIASRLKPEGVFAMNIESVGWQSRLVSALAATLESQFKEVLALPMHEPPNALGNLILVAANRMLHFPEEWMGHPADYADIDPRMHWIVIQKNHAWDNRFRPKIENTEILTDDLNPVDIWAEQTNRVARRTLHDFFGVNGYSW